MVNTPGAGLVPPRDNLLHVVNMNDLGGRFPRRVRHSFSARSTSTYQQAVAWRERGVDKGIQYTVHMCIKEIPSPHVHTHTVVVSPATPPTTLRGCTKNEASMILLCSPRKLTLFPESNTYYFSGAPSHTNTRQTAIIISQPLSPIGMSASFVPEPWKK